MPAEIVPIELHSDGDTTHRPKPEWKLVDPPTIYLEKLGTLWMEARGQAKPGIKYYLNHLPSGYALFERPRPQNAKISDRHLYGHPRHKFFDSPNRFYAHFEYLMNKESNARCPCTICNATGSHSGSMGRFAGKVAAKSIGKDVSKFQTPSPAPKPVESSSVDKENDPDIIRVLIDDLKRHGTSDQDIKESMSMEWRAERTLLPDMFQTVSKQRSWIPRVAEIVLFVKDIDGEICFDAAAKDYKIFKEFQGDGIFTGHPQWQAGLIGQVADESLQLEDLLFETSKRENVTYSGFRVEPFPEPNNKDKALSKQYKYVPLHHIRPFVLWQEFVKGISQTEWHPTIKNALTVMSSMSLLEKYRFRGTWPNATILCRGIYIGSELICVGDTVRIIPAADGGEVTDIIRVDAVKLRLSNLEKASENDNDDGHPYNSSVSIAGRAYTLDLNRAWSKTPISRFDISRAIPIGMDGYGDWYLLHDPSKQYQISFTRVLGRCFEADPMLLWFPATETDDPKADLSKGLEGVRAARRFSSTNDTRILDGKSWFWGDCRAEALDIDELNGVRMSAHDDYRDDNLLELWRKSIKVMDKTAGVEEKMALTQAMTQVNSPSKMLGGHLNTEMNTETSLAMEDDTPMSESGVDTDPLQAFKMGEMENARKRSHSAADVGSSPSASSSRRGTSEESQDLLSTNGTVKPVIILGTGRLQSQSTPGREREDSASKKPRVVIEIDA